MKQVLKIWGRCCIESTTRIAPPHASARHMHEMPSTPLGPSCWNVFPSIPLRKVQPGGFPWIYSPITLPIGVLHTSQAHTDAPYVLFRATKPSTTSISPRLVTKKKKKTFRFFCTGWGCLFMWREGRGVGARTGGSLGGGGGRGVLQLLVFSRLGSYRSSSPMSISSKHHWEPLSRERATCAGMCPSGTNRSFRAWLWFQNVMWRDTEGLRTLLWYASHLHYRLVIAPTAFACCGWLVYFLWRGGNYIYKHRSQPY